MKKVVVRNPVLRVARFMGLMVVLGLVLASVSSVFADLQLLKPLVTDPATFQGNGGYSADGLGQVGTGATLQADVPAGSTVVQAYLYSTHYFQSTPIPLARRTVDLDGTIVVLSELTNAAPGPCCNLRSARADVTAQVAAKVGGGGGITNFAVNTDPANVDGYALVVIFSNPALPFTTIAVMDGGAQQTGDTTVFNFASPLDKTIPGFSAIMSLGIGFGFQGTGFAATHQCGTGQFSVVDVNGVNLTSCAGNKDDGGPSGGNGTLITVGGVGDSINNPIPNQQGQGQDDELYNLAPFLSQGDNQVVIDTANPSGDDIVFLAVIAITAEAKVTTEICNDGIDNDGDGLIDGDDPDCDTAGPTCALTAVNFGPPISIEITTQDILSGLDQINVLVANNVTVAIPAFASGETNPVVVTATKINNALSASVTLEVIDVAGNVTVCDPVITLEIREDGKPVSHTFENIPEAESNVTVTNGDPGVKNLEIDVNGTKFSVAGLKDDEERKLSISSAMVPGNNNTITLTAKGKPGGTVLVVIAD